MDDIELGVYLATRSSRGLARAYARLEKDDPYVRVGAGSITIVIGMPSETLANHLHLFGI